MKLPSIFEKLLKSGYEPGYSDDGQVVCGEWWKPVLGCDSLEPVLETAYYQLQNCENGKRIPQEILTIAENLKACGSTWELNVNLLGNVKAEDIVKLCDFILSFGHV